MRLLTLTIDFLPNSGGLARYADSLARVFAHDMTVVADVRVSHEEERDMCRQVPYTLHYEPFMKTGFPKWRGAFGILRRECPDVVIVHHALPLGTAAWLFGLWTKTPFVVCLHGMDFATACVRPWKRFLLKRVLKSAHTVVANSRALAERVEALTNRQALVCYPTPWIHPHAPVHQKEQKRALILASVSRLVERKGIQRVLKTLASMPKWHCGLRYHITGVGPHASAIRADIKRYGLEDIVTLNETDAPEALRRAYEEADIFILPTTTSGGDTEGFGIVYLEAAQFGVPSIASRQNGVDEAVIDEKTGILVSNDDELTKAIARLVMDASLRSTLGAQARTRAKTFTPESQFQSLKERLYD